MADPRYVLIQRFQAAMQAAFGPDYAQVDPIIATSANPKFGDYQANVAMSLAKSLGRKPREVAAEIVSRLDLADLAEPVPPHERIAGPGFINVKLSTAFLEAQAASLRNDPRLGMPSLADRKTVVVDYSSPNVAKEMHVGHLRSTIIGDAIARVLDFVGHHVIRQNHLGDWGTQFGMLIELLIEQGWQPGAADISDLNALYQQAKKRDDQDADFAERARRRVVALQGGDPTTLAVWRALVSQSERYFARIYSRMNVLLEPGDIRGESCYNDRLPQVVADLEASGLLRISQGAAVVYPPGFQDREGNPLPMIVRKSDGGYLYATTDLAAARYRLRELAASRIIYVTDARQAQHFAMVFATLREAGWAGEEARFDHVPFGTILGKDNKPFKTREGGTIRLVDLLDEAQARAAAIIAEKNPDLADETREHIAQAVGIGALKYADLSVDRIKDYVFDWDRMLAMEGNTAPYLQNAYVRIRSIFRRGGIDPAALSDAQPLVREPAERALVVKLLQWPSVVQSVADVLEPHRLCTWLYELASSFHSFYENCPVLIAPDPQVRTSRLLLCDLTARTLETGLGLLGIQTVEQM